MSSKRQKNETFSDVDEKIAAEIKCPLRIFFSNTTDDGNDDSNNGSTSSTLPVELILPFLEPKDVGCISQVCKAANETVNHRGNLGQRLLKIHELRISDDAECTGLDSKEARRMIDSVHLYGLQKLVCELKEESDFSLLLYALKSTPNLTELDVRAVEESINFGNLKEDDFTALMQLLMNCDRLTELRLSFVNIWFTKSVLSFWNVLTKKLSKTLVELQIDDITFDIDILADDAGKIFSSLENLTAVSFVVDFELAANQFESNAEAEHHIAPLVSSVLCSLSSKNLVRFKNRYRLCKELDRHKELEVLCNWLEEQPLPKLESFWYCYYEECQKKVEGDAPDFARLMKALGTNPGIEVIRVPISNEAERKIVCDYVRKHSNIDTVEFSFHPKFVEPLPFTKELATIHKLKDFEICEMKCTCEHCWKS